MHLLFDGDIMLYKAASVCQEQYYTVAYKQGIDFYYKKDAIAWCDERGLDISGIHDIQYRLKDHKNIMDALENYDLILNGFLSKMSPNSFTVFLTNDRNKIKGIRYKLATTIPYKENRKCKSKPILFKALKKVISARDNTVVSDEQYEADDMIASKSTELSELNQCNAIISTDKDFNQVPTTIINLDTYEVREISELDGFKSFCHQMLTGDAIDNIPGVKGIGRIRASKLLDKVSSKKISWKVVCDTYTKHGIHDRLYEIANLLWLRRNIR